MKKIHIAALSLLMVSLIGCSESTEQSVDEVTVDARDAFTMSDFFVEAEPQDALSVSALKQSEASGTVAVTGVIGGRAEPFVEGRAMFTLSDLDIPYCTLEEGCKTPWDACCNPPEDNIAAMITVQLSDADGNVLQENLQDLHGLEPMAHLTVAGEVVERDESALVLNAKQIFVHANSDSVEE